MSSVGAGSCGFHLRSRICPAQALEIWASISGAGYVQRRRWKSLTTNYPTKTLLACGRLRDGGFDAGGVAPEAFEVVEVALGLQEDVDDHDAVVHKDP
jgi:hypothetical protein